MTAARIADPAKLAEPLASDEIHVWHLARPADAGRAPLRAVLARYLGLDPAALAFRIGPHGRPTLAGNVAADLDFNWSHSGGEALVALGRGLQPGVDLELARPRRRALELARRFFPAAEAALLAELAPAALEPAFLDLWTAREAVLKALGRGLAFGPARVEFTLAAGAPALHRLEGEDIAAWQCVALALGPGRHAALAWRGGPRRIVLHPLAECG